MSIRTRVNGTRAMGTGSKVVPIRRREGGYVAEGPGFYIWDEDPTEVVRVARELERGVPRLGPGTRLLVVPPQVEDSVPG